MYISRSNMLIIFILLVLSIFITGMVDRLIIYKNQTGQISEVRDLKFFAGNWIGIGIKEVNIQNKTPHKIFKIIDVLPDSPAMQAGIKEGDILKNINGKKITSKEDIKDLIVKTPIGKSIYFHIFREKKKSSFIVEITNFSSEK